MSKRGNAPEWRVVVDVVRAAAERGEHAPSDTALAAHFGAYPNTIYRALNRAVREGAIRVHSGRPVRVIEAGDGTWRTMGVIVTPGDAAWRSDNRRLTAEQSARRKAFIAEARDAGLSMDQIAAQLGLTTKALAWWQRNQEIIHTERQEKRKQRVERNCLRCGDPFQSEGVHNRMCGNCRALSHLDSPYMPDPGGSTGKRAMARRA